MWPFKKKEVPVKEKTLYEQFGGKENRIKQALGDAVSALEKDIIFYDWKSHGSCNCGIVVQAIMSMDRSNTKKLFLHARNEIGTYKPEEGRTWREVLQKSCSVTGEPITQVFKILRDKGLQPEDIVHLEYLNNKAILEVTDIDTSEKMYHSKKDNLIKYLKGWLQILKGEYDEKYLTDKAVLEAKFLIAKNGEDFEAAAKLSKQIHNLN